MFSYPAQKPHDYNKSSAMSAWDIYLDYLESLFLSIQRLITQHYCAANINCAKQLLYNFNKDYNGLIENSIILAVKGNVNRWPDARRTAMAKAELAYSQ